MEEYYQPVSGRIEVKASRQGNYNIVKPMKVWDKPKSSNSEDFELTSESNQEQKHLYDQESDAQIANEDSDFEDTKRASSPLMLLDVFPSKSTRDISKEDHHCKRLILVDIGVISGTRSCLEVCMCSSGTSKRGRRADSMTCGDFLELVRAKYSTYVESIINCKS